MVLRSKCNYEATQGLQPSESDYGVFKIPEIMRQKIIEIRRAQKKEEEKELAEEVEYRLQMAMENMT